MDAKTGIDQQASRTALSAAMVRHMLYKDAYPDFPGTDDLAGLFLPPNIKTVLFFPFLRRTLRRKFVGGYEYIFARTVHYDNLFRRALDENIPQIVLMGAGYDTRAVRFEDSIQQTRIFELDAPHTQQQKQAALQKAGIAISPQVTYVPVNFSKQSLQEVLLPSGFDPSARTLFLWEGVSFYLSADDVVRTLEFIREHSGAGSQLAFDYSYLSAIDGTADYYGAKETAQAVSEDREPFTFGIEAGTIESYLGEYGFEIVSHYDPEEFARIYLTNPDGERLGQMYGFVCNVICQPAV